MMMCILSFRVTIAFVCWLGPYVGAGHYEGGLAGTRYEMVKLIRGEEELFAKQHDCYRKSYSIEPIDAWSVPEER
jgi:hypothetical protein